MRRLLILAWGCAALVAVDIGIFGRERLLAGGTPVVLELAPVDPRSLMQGDYMRLRFAIAADVAQAHLGPDAAPIASDPFTLHGAPAADGWAVLAPDAEGVARFVRLDDGRPLAAGELRLRWRLRGGEVRIVTDAFFFEEGQAARFAPARYGRLRVAPDGEGLFEDLLGPDLRALGRTP